MIKSWLILSLLILISCIGNTQVPKSSEDQISLDFKLNNPSIEINDGVATVDVYGGNAPYEYKWSNKATGLDENKATALIEGLPYTLTVTDSAGKTTTQTFTIPAKSITEIFNSKVQPAVDILGAILFWDPFASLGIHDPI